MPSKKMTSKNIKKCQKTSKMPLLFDAADGDFGMILDRVTRAFVSGFRHAASRPGFALLCSFNILLLKVIAQEWLKSQIKSIKIPFVPRSRRVVLQHKRDRRVVVQRSRTHLPIHRRPWTNFRPTRILSGNRRRWLFSKYERSQQWFGPIMWTRETVPKRIARSLPSALPKIMVK
jgi:hypothetical protein